jgi:hypothetical protein
VNVLSDEEEISRLRNKLNKSRRNLKVVGIVSAILIVVLFLGFIASALAYMEMLDNVNEELNEELDELEASISELVRNATFVFYYSSQCEQRYGVDDLESYLNRWQWIEGTYVRDKFDCSEMSAYLEMRLENEGYHTIIVVGQSPSNIYVKHCWLLVETNSGEYMPVEATQYELVKWNNPYFDSYFEYEHSFETIFDALDYNYNEFDWWES